MIDLTTDGHVHSSLCHHAVGKMEDYVKAAIARGLKKIIFLEHLETGISYFESTWLSDREFDLYLEEGERLQDSYRGQLEIGIGVEVGYNPFRRAELLKKLGRYQWDRVGISYHFIRDNGSHLNMVSRKKSNLIALERFGLDRVISTYFTDLKEAVQAIPADVLCHLDAVLRFQPDLKFKDKDLRLINELLDETARQGLALEVNSSGYRIRNEPYPSLSLLNEAINRDIPLVAGSDAHRPEDVGQFFDRLALLA